MKHKTSFRQTLAGCSHLLPTLMYVFLADLMPLQHRLVVEDAVARFWPAIYDLCLLTAADIKRAPGPAHNRQDHGDEPRSLDTLVPNAVDAVD